MNIFKWILGMIIFLLLSIAIIKYNYYSIGLIVLVSTIILIISLLNDRKQSKNNY